MNLYFFVFVAFSVTEVWSKCPYFSRNSPCVCQTNTDSEGKAFSTVTCQNIHSELELQSVIAQCKGLPLFELELLDCSLRYLPHDTFENTKFQVLSIRNSSIISLTDSDVAFKGLENDLRLIEIIHCRYTNNWDWYHLSRLKRIIEIHVSNTELLDITGAMATIQNKELEALVFQKNNIQMLADDVFVPFKSVHSLLLDNNFITTLKRSMFSNPAKKLKVIGLSYNSLSSLPQDIFKNMPALKSLYLTGNPLHTIDEDTFKPIWRQLSLFLFYATRLSCDCRIAWLTKEDNSKKFMHAECRAPGNLKGRSLQTISLLEATC